MKKVDIAIFEVGLGGRFDATNVIRPLVSVITSISFDHTKELGSSLSDIAGEKAGIIKNGVDCISAPQDREALKIISRTCRKLGSKLYLVGRDITYKSVSYSLKNEILNIKGLINYYRNIKLPLPGEHQLINCAVSVSIADLLTKFGFNISKKSVYNGIRKVKWPGRCEVINKIPKLILDCAHNRASANALKKTITRNFEYNKIILILGVSSNKDIKGICNELEALADKIVLTKAGMSRAAEPKHIRQFFKRKEKIIMTNNIKEAYKISRALAGDNDIILATGSIFLVGELRKNEQSK